VASEAHGPRRSIEAVYRAIIRAGGVAPVWTLD